MLKKITKRQFVIFIVSILLDLELGITSTHGWFFVFIARLLVFCFFYLLIDTIWDFIWRNTKK